MKWIEVFCFLAFFIMAIWGMSLISQWLKTKGK